MNLFAAKHRATFSPRWAAGARAERGVDDISTFCSRGAGVADRPDSIPQVNCRICLTVSRDGCLAWRSLSSVGWLYTRNCHAKWREYEEKMSDVHIAPEPLRDAFKDNFDTAILVSADADLLPPIEAIKEDFPEKKIVFGYPPRRDNPRLTAVAQSTFRIGRGRLSKCQLPSSVTKPDGYVLSRPKEWS